SMPGSKRRPERPRPARPAPAAADRPAPALPPAAPAPGRRIALIAAPGRQLPFPARPDRLFSPSEFFTLALTLAGRTANRTYILSPHYGLLPPDGPAIAPYRSDPPDLWP